MIVVKIKGGLGNQMFEYAMARKISIELGIAQIGLDLDIISRDNLRNYGLKYFNLCNSASIINDDQKKLISRMQENFAKRIELNFIAGRSARVSARREKELEGLFSLFGIMQKNHSDGSIHHLLKIHKNIYMNGWFQNADLLKTIRNVLLSDFTWKSQPVSDVNKKLAESIERTEAICVHIRRGDYVNHPQFDVCTEDYYYRAMELLASKLKRPVFYIFSDSIEDVKRLMKFSFPVVFENPDDQEQEGLFLMSRCKHFIMSNSTYSWWAQFLGTYDEKIVVAPNQWYRGEREECPTQYMEDWILLEV